MRLHLEGTIRGRSVWVEWQDGVLAGDRELLRRLQRHLDDIAVDLTDAAAVVRALEQVSGQRLDLNVIEHGRLAS